MKKLFALAILSLPLVAADNGKLNDTERAYLLQQLEQSKTNLLASLNGLTPAQWTFKPSPTVWSVAECAEHLVLAEDFIFGNSQQMLQSPAVDRPNTSNADYDKKIVAGIQDRTKKATAPEPIVPTGKLATPADAVREFSSRRDRHIEYARNTQDDLRVHLAPSPAGPMDAYQFLLLMAAHTVRHTAQLREVQANPSYPKGRGAR